MIPILQERKMMISQVRHNCDYFYTRCDISTQEERAYKHFIRTGDQAVDVDAIVDTIDAETPREEINQDRRVE